MIVIHALWRDGGLTLWGEDSLAPPGVTRAGDHPFAATAEDLATALGGAMRTTRLAAVTTLSLPTRGKRPLDSPELVRDEPPKADRGAVTLAPWRVPTLALDPDEALEVLAALSGPADDGVPAASTRALVEIAAFAADLVARGRLLPSLRGNRALWLPVLTGADAAWAQALALALPPAARAAGGDAATIVAEALDALVDAAARGALPAHDHPHPTAAANGRSGARPPKPASSAKPPKPASAARPANGLRDAWRRWARALRGPERAAILEVEEIAPLQRALADWQRDAVAGRVRACFRLVEPPETEEGPDTWRLEFALQAVDEPSLMVDADRVWSARGTLKALARHLDSPQETLLTELGRASRLYPELDDALRTAQPSGLELDPAEAHQFLRTGAPMLAGAGFGVLLPGWWSKPRAKLGARLTASSPTAPGTVASASSLGLDSLIDYQWDLALGDEPLTEDELRALTECKAPLVRLRGQWVELDAKRLAAALKLLATSGQMTVADLLHSGLSMQDGPGGLPVVSVTAEGALGELLTGEVDTRLQPVPAPPEFTGTLRPYQERGLAWLSFLERLGLGSILADDMGLGKSATVLALVLGSAPGEKTLLVCPMSLVGNWQREVAKFAPSLRVHVHHGAERAKGKKFRAAVDEADLVITTYALAARDAAELAEIAWHRVVVDEAQAIKNAATRQAVAVRGLRARHRIAVTGTPVENRLADLWSLMEFANPGLLGSASSFKTRFAQPVEQRADEEAAERLKRLTGPFVLRRVKTDKTVISDLPDKIEMEVVCNLTAEQASLYQAVVEDMMKRIETSEGIERRGLVLATMTKLKQVCNHPAQLLRDGSRLTGRSGKLARLDEILDEVLSTGEKALLFTQYAEFGGMLRGHLSARFGREVLFLHGGVNKADRDAMVARFSTADAGGPPLFVLSLKAGGTGLTLTAANHVIHVDRWWNPAVEDQATDRAFRIGQTRNVQVRKFVCAGTVEEKISAMIAEKRGLAARIVGTGEQWISELSTSELRELFTLEAGAVVE